jgi:hypothetical protein
VTVAQLTRKHGIGAATCHHWKSKYAGAGLSVDHRDVVPFTGKEPRAGHADNAGAEDDSRLRGGDVGIVIARDKPTSPPQYKHDPLARERRQMGQLLAPKRVCVRVERLMVGVGVGIEAGHERLRSISGELPTPVR